MLTTDLVRARVTDGTLEVLGLSKRGRLDAIAAARELLEVTRAAVNEPRELVLEAHRSVDVRPRLTKVRDGLSKLLLDACTFEPDAPVDPVALRRTIALRATEARRAAAHVEAFDRAALVAALAAEHGVEPAELERLLYSDLRGAHRLLEVTGETAEQLVDRYELALEQAVLLRAERVVVDVRCRSAAAYRALLRRVKFLRLLVVVDALPDGRYRLTLEGPYALHAATTKYGLELALLLPLLRETDAFELHAVVRWGKARERVAFRCEGTLGAAGSAHVGEPPELASLRARFDEAKTGYRVEPADTLLAVRGEMVIVPDLAFTHLETGEVLFLELLGYHHREAVFRRVDLAPKLPAKVLFVYSSRLSVSPEVMPESLPAGLLPYKGTLRATAVLEALEALRTRPSTCAVPPPATPAAEPPEQPPRSGRSKGPRAPKKSQ